MKAIGRALVPDALPRRTTLPLDLSPADGMVDRWERPVQRDPWLLRGLLWRPSCGLLVPVRHLDGSRAYSCGTTCGHSEVPAKPIERDLLLKVLVRAAFALKRPALVSAVERSQWRHTNPLDSHSMLVAGFIKVEVDGRGDWHLTWRHEVGRAPVLVSATGS